MSKQSFSAIFASLTKLFLALTLFSIPFSLRHIFYEKNAYLSGMFTETTAIFINATEILLWLTAGFYLMQKILLSLFQNSSCQIQSGIQSHRYHHFSLNQPLSNLQKIQNGNILDSSLKIGMTFSDSGVLWALLLFFLFNILTVFWSRDNVLSLLFSFKILEGIVFAYLLTRKILPPRQIAIILGLLCLFEGGLALEQFYLQHSLGLKFLGESYFNAQTLGVAKIDFPDHKIIRSYGTFPHPNLLAAFFVIVFFYLDSLNFAKIKYLLLIPLFFTFSRSAFLAIFMGLMVKIFCHSSFFYSVIPAQAGISLREKRPYFSFVTINKGRACRGFLRSLFPLILLAFFFLLPLYFFFPSRLQIDPAILDRLTLAQTSLQMFFDHPWGVGNAHFLHYAQDYAPQILKPWEFMPAHNLYLLILNENGFFGLLIFLLFIALVLKQIYRNHKPLLPLFCAMLTLALFDHYFWDIDQGRWLWYLIIGLGLNEQLF